MAELVSACFPNRCVANPTITPRSMPGSMMSQNNAMPAFRIRSMLNTAAIKTPAKIPSGIEWTRFDKNPMATPETNPFMSENVMTLPISGAKEGSRKPLRPSSRPSVPPTARPIIGFVALIFHLANSISRNAASFGIRIALHYSEQISFGILAVCEVPDRRNSGLRHDFLTAGSRDRGDGFLDGLDVDRVGGCGDVSPFHQAAINSRRAIRAGGHHPILHWPRPLFDLPAECFFVECRGALRIVRGDFKMYDSRHSSSPVVTCRSKLFLVLPYCGCHWHCRRGAETLCSVAHDESNNAARQNDSEIVIVHVQSNEQCKKES